MPGLSAPRHGRGGGAVCAHGRPAPCLVALLALGVAVTAPAAAALPSVQIGACGWFISNDPSLWHVMDFAANIAFEEGLLDDVIPNRNFSVSISPANTECSSTIAGGITLPMLLGRGQETGRIFSNTTDIPPVIAVSGCACSSSTTVVSQLATPLEVPVVSGAATNALLSNKVAHPYFVRTIPPDSKQGAGLAALVAHFAAQAPLGGWQRVFCVYAQESYAEGITSAFIAALSAKRPDMQIFREPLPNMPLFTVESAAQYNYSNMLSAVQRVAELTPKPRLFVYTLLAESAGPVMRAFQEVGLFGTGGVIFASESLCNMQALDYVSSQQEMWLAAIVGTPAEALWSNASGAYDWGQFPSLLEGMMCMVPDSFGRRFWSPGFLNFWTNLTQDKLVAAGMPEDYLTKPEFFENRDTLSAYAILRFDGFTTLLRAISDMLGAGTPLENVRGRDLKEAVFAANFEGISGPIAFDENGDRLAPYRIKNLRSTPEFFDIGEYDAVSQALRFDEAPTFAGGSREIPADRPYPCPVGEEAVDDRCEPCAAGRYGPEADSTCIDCAPGYFASAGGMTACSPAASGRHVPAGRSEDATSCQRGTFSAEFAATSCEECALGFFAASDEATACEWCSMGTYMNFTGASACFPCPQGETTTQPASGGLQACVCVEGTFRKQEGKQCQPCPEGMDCPVGADLQHMPGQGEEGPHPLVKSGYMTLASDVLMVYACKVEAHCPGGAPATCADFRETASVACGECQPTAYSSGTACLPCGDGTSAAVPLAIAVVISILVVGAVSFLVNRDIVKVSNQGLTSAVLLGLLFTGMQTLGVFESLSFSWFEPVRTMLTALQIFKFDVEFLKLGCVFGSDPVMQYVFRHTIAPALALVMLLAVLLKRCAIDGRTKVLIEATNAVGTVFNTLFISILVSCIMPLVCYSHPGDIGLSMSSSPSIICFEGGSHTSMLLTGMVALILVPLPFAALCTYGVIYYPQFSHRPAGMLYFQAFRFLYIKFTPASYYFGIVLLVRSLVICLIPVVTRDPALQISLMNLTFCIYVWTQTRLQPWGNSAANAIDAMLTFAMVLLLGVGAMGAGLQADSGAIQVLGTLAFGAFFLFAILALLVSICINLCSRSGYDGFVCHHKKDAAAQARLLKMWLHSKYTWAVFLDSDNLQDLEELFDVVKTKVRRLIVYLTRDTLRRPWCAGEVTIATHTASARVIAVWTPSFSPPSEEQLDNLDEYVDVSGCNLMRYGIPFSKVRLAYVNFLSSEIERIDVDVDLRGSRRLEGVVEALGPSKARRTTGSAGGARASARKEALMPALEVEPGSVVISVETTNDEAIAASAILVSKVRLRALAYVPEVCCLCDRQAAGSEGLHEVLMQSRALVVLLSAGSMQAPDQLSAMVDAMALLRSEEPSITVLPVGLPDFTFPGDEYYSSVLPKLFPAHMHDMSEGIRDFFRLIALQFSTHASDQVLEQQAGEVISRIPKQHKARPRTSLDILRSRSLIRREISGTSGNQESSWSTNLVDFTQAKSKAKVLAEQAGCDVETL